MRIRPLLCCAALAAAVLPAAAQDPDSLLAQHAAKKTQLAQSPFGRPLLLDANASAEVPKGSVYAVVDHPFATVAGTLKHAAAWCDVLILQSNIKRCLPAGSPDQPALQVAVGRKSEQTAEDAFQVEFGYALRAARDDYLAVQLTAAEGPVGTSDYRLGFEAVPLGPQKTFVRMSYSYAAGTAARMATDLYLSTSGRNKVGFSVTGHDAAGKPVYVRGIQGVAERNTMRYFLAIEALLGSLSAAPAQRAEKRLHDWFAATERYPQQLHELDEAEYIAMKRRELQLQVAAARRKGSAS